MISIATAVLVTVTTLAQPVSTAPDQKAPASQPAPGTEQPRQPGGPGGGQGGGQPGRPGGERRGISVEGAMKIMDRAMEPLNNDISNPAKRDENLGHVNEMQRGCVIAKGLPVPKELLEKAGNEAAQTKLKQEYRSHMFALLKKLISLEEAIADGKTDDAKKLLDEVAQERDRGHSAMGMAEDSNVSPFYPK